MIGKRYIWTEESMKIAFGAKQSSSQAVEGCSVDQLIQNWWTLVVKAVRVPAEPAIRHGQKARHFVM